MTDEGVRVLLLRYCPFNEEEIEMSRSAVLLAAVAVSVVALVAVEPALAGRCSGIEAERIAKLQEGRPNITDAITDGQIQLVINTPRGKESKQDDSYIRTTAVRRKVPHITTLAAALAAAKGIAALGGSRDRVRSLQEYHADIH